MKSAAVYVLIMATAVSAADTCTVSVLDTPVMAGAEAEVPVVIATSFDSEAFSFGLTHDAGRLDLLEIIQGDDVTPLNGGGGPWFWQAAIEPQDVTCGQATVRGGTIACIYTSDAAGISSGAGLQVARFRYAPVMANGSAQLHLRDCLGTPQVNLRVTYNDGMGFSGCDWQSGTVYVTDAGLQLTDGPTVAQGETFSVKAALTVQGAVDVSGFSFAVSHDTDVLSLDSITYDDCADMTGLNGGSGPDFFLATVHTDGWVCGPETVYGGSVDCIVDNESVETLHPGARREIAKLTYTARATGFPGSSDLTIGAAGCIPGDVVPAIALAQGFSATPATSSTTVTVQGLAFTRGDASQDGARDIGDAVCVLSYMFRSGCPTLTCLESADANGDGALDIADPVRLLGYLFISGPPPAAPFPDCGLPAAYSLGCVQAPACK